MRVRLAPLFAVLCFGAMAIASVGCGNPDAKVQSLSETSATATSEATATAGAIETPTLDATRTAEAAATSSTEATQPPASPTSEPLATSTTGLEPVATRPPPCRQITFSPGETLTAADLAARGHGSPVRKPFLGVNLVIRRIGVDAPFIVRVVPDTGVMPASDSPTAVSWYDFSQFEGLGGTPGTDHGNIVIAGNYDYNGVPQAVFYRLSELVPGDLVQINTSDGRTLAYEVEFNKVITVDGTDWSELAASTPEESITLITAGAPLNKDRRIVWGRAMDTGCSH